MKKVRCEAAGFFRGRRLQMVIAEEWRRIFGGRLLWALFAGAMVVNLWIIWNFGSQKPFVEAAGALAEKGVESITEENREEIIRVLSEAEKGQSRRIPVRNMVEGAEWLAENMRASDLAQAYVEFMKLGGGAEEYARKVYAALEPQMEENRINGTARGFFVPCHDGFFELYSRWLPFACTLESILAAVLLMMRYVNAPFDQKMGAVVYSSRVGRRISRQTGVTVLLTVAGFAGAVWAISYGAAEAVFSMGEFWETRLGSMMVLDTFNPLIARFPMSIRTYTVLQFLISVCVALLFAGMAYSFVGRSHSTFTAFWQMALVCFAVAVLTQVYPRDSIVYFALRFNPVNFADKAGHWFVSGGTFLSARFCEVGFVLFWGIRMVLLCVWQNRRFQEEDLV